MTASLHHSKTPSELPQIIRYTPQQTKIVLKTLNPFTQTQSKKSTTKHPSHQSAALPEPPSKINLTKLTFNKTKQMQFMKNSYNPKSQTLSLGLGSPNMMQKMLQKNKKYFRVDAHLKNQNNIVKSDIENLIESMVSEKEKNDYIVLNLRDKFQTNNRSMTLNKRALTIVKSKHRKSTKLVTQPQGISCPISSVNTFKTVKNNIKNRIFDEPSHANRQNFALNCLLNTQVKNFKQLIKQYIHNFKSTICQETSMKNSYLMSGGEKKSGLREERQFSIKEDDGKSNLQKTFTKKIGNNYYKEFLQLSEKSQDYLEYYLKSSFMTQFSGGNGEYDSLNDRNSIVLNQTRQQIDRMLKKMEKNAILSVLRSNSKCLQSAFNPKQIVNRILLAMNINPMNQFHFIKQDAFTKFKKLSTNQGTRKESRQFLLRYFCLQSLQVKKSNFDNLLYCLLSKLLPILNQSTIEILFGKVKKICEQLIGLSKGDEIETTNKRESDKQNLMIKEENTKSGIVVGNKRSNNNKQANPPQNISSLSNNRHTFEVQTIEKEDMLIDKQKSTKTKNCKTSHIGVRTVHNNNNKQQVIYKRQEIKGMLLNDTFGLWDEILQLIFIV